MKRRTTGSIVAVLFFVGVLLAAVTQIDLTTQVKGILPTANGGTGQNSTATFPTSGTVMTTSTAVAATQLPNPSATTLGGVESKDCTGSGHIVAISNSGVPSCAADAGALNFADDETPSGTVNGANTSFTLAHTPNPAASLQLFKNGQKLEPGGADFTLATATITASTAPKTGDILTVSYRW